MNLTSYMLAPKPLRYKLCFIALDGTDEAEMICFGDVARRIIGKPVQQLLKTTGGPNTYPVDITSLVSLRFTFAVTLTQQSFYRHQKTYQVASMVTTYGHYNAVPGAGGAEADNGSDDDGSTQTILGATVQETGNKSPTAVAVIESGSPPVLNVSNTPVS